jgi:hypothetical protein
MLTSFDAFAEAIVAFPKIMWLFAERLACFVGASHRNYPSSVTL